jgi:hypothetical protein
MFAGAENAKSIWNAGRRLFVRAKMHRPTAAERQPATLFPRAQAYQCIPVHMLRGALVAITAVGYFPDFTQIPFRYLTPLL